MDELEDRGWDLRRSSVLDTAVQAPLDADVTATEAFRSGQIEVQDIGSQLVLESAEPSPGGRWLDACAGAGGKSLQLARMLGPGGRVDAHDIRPAALRELGDRAARAGAGTIRIRTRVDGSEAYDGVLVDAPCSGSGTWRRAPHLKWCTGPADAGRHSARQLGLLSRFAAFVAPGGRLVYATCSLSRLENEAVVAGFLETHPSFAMVPPRRDLGFLARPNGRTLLPSVHDSDGFFVAVLGKE